MSSTHVEDGGVPAGADDARATRDRDHYDRIAGALASKDRYAPSRLARAHRHVRSVELTGASDLGAVLEIGCGCGFAAEYLSGHYARFVGIDHSAGVIDAARTWNARDGVSFAQVDGRRLSAEALGGPFDTVFMIGVLHHVPEPVALLRQAMACLRPGGLVIANEPQDSNPAIRALRRLRKRGDADYSDEQDEYAPAVLRAILEEAGLEKVALAAQGLFSTPFAEVKLPPAALTRPLAAAACWADRGLERLAPGAMRRLSWNLVAYGRTAEEAPRDD
ncbi:MAG: class I SAM-dependent methyltransferase [Pseudomonadota bacterium]